MATVQSLLPEGGVRVELIAAHSLTAGDSILLTNAGPHEVFISETDAALLASAANPAAAHRIAPAGLPGVHGIQLTVPAAGAVYAWSPHGSAIVLG